MSDLREALKTLRDANMSYSLVSDVKNARRLEQAMRDAEAALAQPEAVGPVAVHYLHTHPEHGEDVSRQRLTEHDKKYGWEETPLYTTPPLAPDARGVDSGGILLGALSVADHALSRAGDNREAIAQRLQRRLGNRTVTVGPGLYEDIRDAILALQTRAGG
jgi:hypothetical protein